MLLLLQSSRTLEFPPPGTTEIPNCPVCLERMDATVSGVLTLTCNHSFHCKCLSRWKDSSCPVCRYASGIVDEETTLCMACGSDGTGEDGSLWMCIICGHVGCGRYSGGHAHAHFEASKHAYSMNLRTQRVWDYVGDGSVSSSAVFGYIR
jgi:BRCA1-associated protein